MPDDGFESDCYVADDVEMRDLLTAVLNGADVQTITVVWKDDAQQCSTVDEFVVWLVAAVERFVNV